MSSNLPQSMDDRPLHEKFPDVMCDIETTGLSFDRNAILQIVGVRFNLEERTIGHDFFDRCLTIPSTRFWDEETRAWWLKKRPVLMSLLGRGEDPLTVMRAFRDWAGHHNLTFWGKPTHFDHSFLSSYFRDFNVANPFHYRNANDMNSFIRGRYFPQPQSDHQWEWELPFDGPKHDALYDSLHQIKTLFEVMKDTSVSHQGGFDKLLAERNKQIEEHPEAPLEDDDVPF